MQVRLQLDAERALFIRPEFDRDLISYDLITPHVVRCVLDAVYRGERMSWIVDTIRILRPIRRECVDEGVRRVLMLRDVAYVVDARVELAPGEPAEMANRHATAFAQALESAPTPYLGRSGSAATATLIDSDIAVGGDGAARGTVDHGWLLYDTGCGSDPRSRFFRAIAIDGLVRVPAPDSPLLFA